MFCESFCTEAVKLFALETCTKAVAGLTDTAMGRGPELMVTLAAFDLVASVTEVALMVIVADEGKLGGAV